MSKRRYLLMVVTVLSLASGCAGTDPPTNTPEMQAAEQRTGTPEPPVAGPTTACQPTDGEGTVSPDVAISSVTFVVNGVEQVVRDDDILQASPGDRVRVKEATICAGPFSGNGGEVCFDLVPVGASGREVAAEHAGSHLMPVAAGVTSISGPERSWIIENDWRGFSAVLNHWPPDGTADPSCADGRCEHDDWMAIRLQ